MFRFIQAFSFQDTIPPEYTSQAVPVEGLRFNHVSEYLGSHIFTLPGIDMALRLERYYRVNYIPTFIAERTPSENREDLWEILESVGLDYYDRFEWLLRTTMRSVNDNLIVERKREPKVVQEFSAGDLLQYSVF